MSKNIIHTENAPAAMGPYSQAVVANGFVFVAGQGAIVPGTGKLIEGGVQEQTRQTMENVKSILEAAGSSVDNIVKTSIFLQDVRDFAAMNEVYATFFSDAPPARTTVQAGSLPLNGLLVEIEVVALAG